MFFPVGDRKAYAGSCLNVSMTMRWSSCGSVGRTGWKTSLMNPAFSSCWLADCGGGGGMGGWPMAASKSGRSMHLNMLRMPAQMSIGPRCGSLTIGLWLMRSIRAAASFTRVALEPMRESAANVRS